jgi:hypothetical protein
MAKQEATGIFRLIAEAVLCASFAGDQPSRTVRENEAQQCAGRMKFRHLERSLLPGQIAPHVMIFR